MRPVLNAYLDAANGCAKHLLRALAVSLGRRRGLLHPPLREADLARLARPLPAAGSAAPATDQFGVAPHTDYGVMTLLHQDDVGGLQVATREGEWVTAQPIAGTLVVNSGDLLGRWSNDRFKSNPHRVVNSSGRERLSVAVFADPDYDTPIVPVSQPGEEAKYPEVRCGEYILGRFDAAFAYRKQG